MPKIKASRSKCNFNIFKAVGWLLLIAVLGLVLFNIGDLVSSLITNQKSFIYGGKAVITQAKSYYAISLCSCATENEALQNSNQIKLQGGAGAIVKQTDNVWQVLASTYKTLEDATTARDNLQNSGLNVEIVVLNISQRKITQKSINDTQLLQVLNLPLKQIEKLIDLSDQFDSKEKSSSQIKTELVAMITELQTAIDIIGQNATQQEEQLKNHLKESKSRLQGVLFAEDKNFNMNSVLKATIILQIQLCD